MGTSDRFLSFLSCLRLAEVRPMCYFSGVVVIGISINFCRVLHLALFGDKVLTGKTPHSMEFLFVQR